MVTTTRRQAALVTPNTTRRRRKRLEATVLVDRTFATETDATRRGTLISHFEQSFHHRKGAKRGKKQKPTAEEDEAYRKAVEREQAMEREIDHLRGCGTSALCIESAEEYQQAIEEEKMRYSALAAEKAHRNMVEGVRLVKERMKRRRKKPKQKDLVQDLANFTVLQTSRQATCDGSQLDKSISLLNAENTVRRSPSLVAEDLDLTALPPSKEATWDGSKLAESISPLNIEENVRNTPLQDVSNFTNLEKSVCGFPAAQDLDFTALPPSKEATYDRSRLGSMSPVVNVERSVRSSPTVPRLSYRPFTPQFTSSPVAAAFQDVEKSWRSNSTLLTSFNESVNCFYLENYVGRSSSLGELLHVCGQEDVLEFTDISRQWDVKAKLGEGVYGEVYLTAWRGKDLAVKVIPFLGDDLSTNVKFNGEELKSARSMIPEVVMTRELSALRNDSSEQTDGFVELHNALVVRGEYPVELVERWEQYSTERGTENDPPSVYSSPQQMYLLLCLGTAGHDLETFKINNDKEASSIFVQVAFSLMVAEEALEFEHRDLHVGNVLVSRDNVPEKITFTFGGGTYRFATHGVKATIIDFTNSRLRKEATTIFVDLSSDPELFNGEGDYQFDIYRMMRDHCQNDWSEFHAYHNLCWMHYLATKLFEADRYPKKQKLKFKKAEKAFLNMLTHQRISEFIVTDDFAPLFKLVDENE